MTTFDDRRDRSSLIGLASLKDGQVIVVSSEIGRDRLATVSRRNVVAWSHDPANIDWRPLANRDAVIWPVAGISGLKTAEAIATILAGHGCRIRIMAIAGRPDGWSAADAVSDLQTKERIDSFMRETVKPWVEPQAEIAEAHDHRSDIDPKPIQKAHTGADGVAAISRFQTVAWGSEVEVASLFVGQLRNACGSDIIYSEGSFWAFGPTAWQAIPEHRLRRAVHSFDGATKGQGTTCLKVGKRMIDGVLTEAGTILSEPGFFDQSTIGVNAKNGTITISEDGRVNLRPHDPEDRFRFTIPAEFHLHTEMHPPEGTMLRKLIHGAFDGDPDADEKISLVSEILGAAAFGLATRLPQPKAFVFLGETASNGKSTIASLLTCLLPAGAVSSIPPSAFGDERRIVNLAGKAANVADELSANAISGETFKAAVTGNPVEGRDLYRSAVTFAPRALHCYTTNTLPRFSGGLDRGLQRRLVVLRFNRTIPENEIMPDIADRIRADELDLLLGFAVAGAQRLIKQRGYTLPKSSGDALREWLLLDPVNEWFETRIIRTQDQPYGGWPRTVHLYDDFKSWAVENGFSERFLPPVNTFGQRLKAVPGVEIRRNDGARLYWAKLRSVADPAPQGGEDDW